MNPIIFSKDTIEFVAVALEYCNILESSQGQSRESVVPKLTKILPLLYLKALMLPAADIEESDELEEFVTEDIYEIIRVTLTEILGAQDDYLEVFLPDMQVSESPLLTHISEDLSDIYQDVKNFIIVYQSGIETQMEEALSKCQNNFKYYWGQKLVNSMGALHTVLYTEQESEPLVAPVSSREFGFFNELQSNYGAE